MRPVLCLALFGCSNNINFEDQSLGDTGIEAPVDAGDVNPDDDTGVESPGPGGNGAPVADAGPDLEATVPEEVKLDGSGSGDPDGDPLNFEWVMVEKPKGSAAFLINEFRVQSSFYADREGLYVVELVVDDGFLDSSDEVEIMVGAPNEGPVANAGPDQTVNVGARVTLDGSNSYDPDGATLVYQWTLQSSPVGSNAFLNDRNREDPEFTADVAGTYVLELRVSDGVANSQGDQVRVIASSGGGGNGGCLSCAGAEQELERRISAGNAASAVGLLLLPLGVLWYRRRSRR